jgi:isopentenyl-diphosphate Delta-isomerase
MSTLAEKVILVDEEDRPIGSMDKMEVHQKGLLHRAFSAFIFNAQGELLLQQRAFSKYHSAGLWTNTCCSHPRLNEQLEKAVHRRLREEMGFDCEVKEYFSFIYKAAMPNGLTEHEYDYVFFGSFDGTPVANPAEVHTCRWIQLDEIEKDLKAHPEKYTAWFRLIFPRIKKRARRFMSGA